MRIKEDAGGDVHVLYVDHQGHPAPLSLCYHATASRRLSSSVDRHPPSTLCEVDSAYCPQCLSFYDAETSASTGYCFKPSCRICPVCQSIASISADETDCFYKCGKCKWTSRHCVIYTTLSVDNQGKYAKDDFNKAVVELGDQSISRVADQDRLAAQHFTTRMAALEGFAKEQVKGQRTTAGHLTPEKLSRWEGWNVQDLETFLDSRGSRMKKSSAEISGAQEGSKISSDNEQELPNGSTVGQLPIALLVHLGSSSTLPEEGLLPRLIPLRPRKSRRCRAELVDGRPGILLKPKLNPLEGDSCLKTGHGQWWKKDSSATMVLPRINVVKHGSDGLRHVFLLKVSNPTLGVIRIRMQPSSYKGEPVIHGDNEDMTSLFDNLIVDSLEQTRIRAKLVTDLTDNLGATQVCELEAAEDSFLELGKSARNDPLQVVNWSATDVLSKSEVSTSSASSTLKFLDRSLSDGWFELAVLETASEVAPFVAIPLSLEIEVGNGSWESSLVQQQLAHGGDKDTARFDFVVTFVSSIRNNSNTD